MILEAIDLRLKMMFEPQGKCKTVVCARYRTSAVIQASLTAMLQLPLLGGSCWGSS